MKRPTKAEIDFAVEVLMGQWREADKLRCRARDRWETYTTRMIGTQDAIYFLTGKFPEDIEAAAMAAKNEPRHISRRGSLLVPNRERAQKHGETLRNQRYLGGPIHDSSEDSAKRRPGRGSRAVGENGRARRNATVPAMPPNRLHA